MLVGTRGLELRGFSAHVHRCPRLASQWDFRHFCHSVRHTHASMLIAAGTDILTVSRRLGHENIRITLDLYGHLLPGQDEAAAAAMDRLTALWQ
ncbi:MAG: hypothetical protein BAA04_06780 [Firmicutes bacterium ZCTH02-B6]|nr:MAG: hypothetical protein BAA04_06780 [Firmicutes bacterium ZCTH02-B6]